MALARPKLRGATAAFASRLFGAHVTKTNALESLVIASFIRGLSVRDVEATLADALGDQAAISKSTARRCARPSRRQEHAGLARRRLDEVKLDDLSWTLFFADRTPAPRPSRCWPPGASPPRASRVHRPGARHWGVR